MTEYECITKVEEYLDNLSPNDFLELNNNYALETDKWQVEILTVNDLKYVMEREDENLLWLARRIKYGYFDPEKKYFTFDDYGNFSSLSGEKIEDVIHLAADKSDIAEYCVTEDEDLEDEKIRNILNEYFN